jgi:hypothetical protein
MDMEYEPGVEGQDKITEDYPGFVVHDGRVSGSITLGHSRLPIWCLIHQIVSAGYASAAEDYPTLAEEASADEIGWFLYDLFEHRREFARLLCVLADVQRRQRQACTNEYGPRAAFLMGGSAQPFEQLGPTLEKLGIDPIIQVDPGNLPPALQPWYADAQTVTRVRVALLSCLEELDRLGEENGDPTTGSPPPTKD